MSDFSDLDISQDGADAVIDFGGGNTLRLENIDATALTADNFEFDASGQSSISVDESFAPFGEILIDTIAPSTLLDLLGPDLWINSDVNEQAFFEFDFVI